MAMGQRDTESTRGRGGGDVGQRGGERAPNRGANGGGGEQPMKGWNGGDGVGRGGGEGGGGGVKWGGGGGGPELSCAVGLRRRLRSARRERG